MKRIAGMLLAATMTLGVAAPAAAQAEPYVVD